MCVYVCALVAQSCPTLCEHMDYRPPDSSIHGIDIHGILQASILEWDAISFSRGSSRTRDRTQVSCVAGGFFTNWATFWNLYYHFYLSSNFRLAQAVYSQFSGLNLLILWLWIYYSYCLWCLSFISTWFCLSPPHFFLCGIRWCLAKILFPCTLVF